MEDFNSFSATQLQRQEREITARALIDPDHLARIIAAGVWPELLKDEYSRAVFTAHAEGVNLSDKVQLRERDLLNSHYFSLVSEDKPGQAEFYLNNFTKNLDAVVASQVQIRRQKVAARVLAGDDVALIAADVLALGRVLPKKKGGWPELLQASILCALPPPVIDVLVDGILVKLGLSIFSGASKSRKTWTALDLSASVASGADWLGRNTVKGPVVYLNFELSQDTMHRRLHAICAARGIQASPDLHLWNLRGHHVTITNLRENLIKLCARIKPVLIILDPFYKVAANAGADENSNDGQARLLSDLEVMARECGALFMLHHFAKGNSSEKNAIDRGSGAGALARAPDAVLTLTEHEDPDCMVLEAALRDFPAMPATSLRWVHPVWQVDDTVDATKLKKSGAPSKHQASDLLPKLVDRMTSAEWENASGWANSTFRRRRDDLVDAGKVTVMMACYYHAKA